MRQYKLIQTPTCMAEEITKDNMEQLAQYCGGYRVLRSKSMVEADWVLMVPVRPGGKEWMTGEVGSFLTQNDIGYFNVLDTDTFHEVWQPVRCINAEG